MKLSEYLAKRNLCVKTLTNAERKAIGVHDYSKGWTFRYANLEVPEQLANAVINGINKKRELKKIANGEITFGNTQLDLEYNAIMQQD